ncbi:MAG: hemerythrin domain-containing protein [Planctomycetales bacterium]|nr:hemerythrin domain-containing protein [Planctomycetales bacterium]NIM08724.1 hemerythrin domain-containing protein [Planctomycetales bacterium]NIN08194.1 hemerythrin domain-containing protein [Planctomycetales bacterium]NIN77322.1 hemerythrin domain-containing protein [Planctomycetales bacterium]NIO34506.1 hemerythrin domain-containing protein [Planctomycetales bacterium]
MATVTSTLTINAAFLQEIKEDNRQLQDLFQQTLMLLNRPRRKRVEPRRIVRYFSWLRDQLALHFALEDAYGYFEDAIAEAPRLSEAAAELHAQHDELFQEICELIEEAEQLMYHERPCGYRETTELAIRFYRFHAEFQKHETRENELVLDAFDQDIGVGD